MAVWSTESPKHAVFFKHAFFLLSKFFSRANKSIHILNMDLFFSSIPVSAENRTTARCLVYLFILGTRYQSVIIFVKSYTVVSTRFNLANHHTASPKAAKWDS